MKRPLVILVLAAATALVAFTPRLNAPVGRLANYDADSRDPITTVAVDLTALRRAAEVLPDDATYALLVADDTRGQLTHDVEGVARLFFLPALPIREARDADWLLRYGEPALPGRLTVVERVQINDVVELLRMR